MRVLVLSKRQYTGHDLIDDRYGRVFEIPAALARLGHQVIGLSLSYRHREEREYSWSDAPGLLWRSRNLGTFGTGLHHYIGTLRHCIATFQPQVLWATSDAFHCMIAGYLSRRTGIPLVLDFYDNYESFGASRFPGVVSGMRMSSRCAARITTVSSTLAQYIQRHYTISSSPVVLGNAIDPSAFFPIERESARFKLGLPANAKLVGVIGSLSVSRGIESVFSAFSRIAETDPHVRFVIAGPRDAALSVATEARIHDFGIVAHDIVPLLLSALNVAVVSNIDSEFGRFCFPQKLYEAIACGVPVVATRVGEVAILLRDYPRCLYEPQSVSGLVDCIHRMLAAPEPISIQAPTWQMRASKLQTVLHEALQERRYGNATSADSADEI